MLSSTSILKLTQQQNCKYTQVPHLSMIREETTENTLYLISILSCFTLYISDLLLPIKEEEKNNKFNGR